MWDPTRRHAARRAEHRVQVMAMVVALVWMLAVQIACVMCWDAGLLTRQASLLHWLVVGVLPPALALWGMETDRTERG